MWERDKILNFIFSFGAMLAGVVLLFIGSISVEFKTNPQFLSLPHSQVAQAQIGGDITPAVLPKARPTVPLAKDNSSYAATSSAVSALVVDDTSDTILFEKNKNEVRPLASITKLMSMLVLLDLPIHWSSSTVVLASDIDASSHQINAGEKYKLSDLFNIALVGSSNSAVDTLVRVSGVTKDDFVELMNQKAKRLNLNSAQFADPTGLDNRNMARAEDIVRLLKIALQQEKILTALQTPEYYGNPIGQKPRRIWNTDWLLTHWIPSDFKKVQIAGKTGYIAESDYNFVVRLTDEQGHAIRVVVLGTASNEARFTEARDLANWTFSHYLWPDESGYDQLAE